MSLMGRSKPMVVGKSCSPTPFEIRIICCISDARLSLLRGHALFPRRDDPAGRARSRGSHGDGRKIRAGRIALCSLPTSEVGMYILPEKYLSDGDGGKISGNYGGKLGVFWPRMRLSWGTQSLPR